ncbi:MAG: glutathione S-transferase family protein [Steroidobacteraceae bacterium]
MYTLYYSPGTASLAVHWMLIHLGVPFSLKLVDFKANEQKSAEYLAINPSGFVPALVVDGRAHAECAALLMLLAERHAYAGLEPARGTPERAEYLQWFFYLANTLQPAFRAWFYPDEIAGTENNEATRDKARLKIEACFARLDACLADGRPYLLGEQLSAVDFLATMLARWSRNMPKPATRFPHLLPYVNRMRSLASLKEVHAREGLTDWITPEAIA